MNAGMSLAAFKTIFLWEYVHRLWGRLIGFVYAMPFLYFLMRGRIPRRLHATASTPSCSRAREGSRENAVTESPRSLNAATSRFPISPVAPVTPTLIVRSCGSSSPGQCAELLGLPEADLGAGGGRAAVTRLVSHRSRDGPDDLSVEDRGDDVVLAQFVG